MLLVSLVGFAVLVVVGQQATFLHASGSTINNAPDGVHFRHAAARIEFVAPAGWQSMPKKEGIALVAGDGCSFIVMARKTFFTSIAIVPSTIAEVKKGHPDLEIES